MVLRAVRYSASVWCYAMWGYVATHRLRDVCGTELAYGAMPGLFDARRKKGSSEARRIGSYCLSSYDTLLSSSYACIGSYAPPSYAIPIPYPATAETGYAATLLLRAVRVCWYGIATGGYIGGGSHEAFHVTPSPHGERSLFTVHCSLFTVHCRASSVERRWLRIEDGGLRVQDGGSRV
eukprot:3481283-Rhodomonas_salina.2